MWLGTAGKALKMSSSKSGEGKTDVRDETDIMDVGRAFGSEGGNIVPKPM